MAGLSDFLAQIWNGPAPGQIEPRRAPRPQDPFSGGKFDGRVPATTAQGLPVDDMERMRIPLERKAAEMRQAIDGVPAPPVVASTPGNSELADLWAKPEIPVANPAYSGPQTTGSTAPLPPAAPRMLLSPQNPLFRRAPDGSMVPGGADPPGAPATPEQAAYSQRLRAGVEGYRRDSAATRAGQATPIPAPANSIAPMFAPGPPMRPSLIENESGGRWDAQNDVPGAGGVGHFGRGQFSRARLQDAANAGIIPQGTTPQQFMAAPDMQKRVEGWHIGDIDKAIDAGGLLTGGSIGGVPITRDGLRAVAHLGGVPGMLKFVSTGGAYNPADANGTRLSDYFSRHGGSGLPTFAGGGGGAKVMPGGTGGDPSRFAAMPPSPVASLFAQTPTNVDSTPAMLAALGQQNERQRRDEDAAKRRAAAFAANRSALASMFS